MIADQNDWEIDGAEWAPDSPDAIAGRISEIRATVDGLDNASLPEMNELFYLNGFNELDLAVRDLLRIVEVLQEPHQVDGPFA